MPSVTRPANQPGEFLVDYEEKVFPDVKAEPGEKIRTTKRLSKAWGCSI